MLIALASRFLGGTADLQAIYRQFAAENPDVTGKYKDRRPSRSTIQSHCPQSEGFREGANGMFEKVGRGRYPIVPLKEQAAVIAAGRKLDK